MAFTFYMPSVSLMGPGCSDSLPEEIKSRGFKKALIVCGKRSAKSAEFKGITDNLASNGVEFVVYPGSQPNPTVTNVMDGVKVLKDNGCDFVISYGGGSPHDCAKGIALVATNGGNIKDYEGVNVSKKPQLPLIAINTTAGTASEMTIFAIITDEERHVKMAIVDKHVNPILAVNDPNLMVSMPASLTAATGMDALTHAIEAYTASLRSNFSDPLAIKAIQMVEENLVNSYAGNEEARNLMHEAQCLAGMSFSNALLGIVHSMAHKVGAVFHIPHGCANAIFLPYVIQYNRTACEDRYADIAKSIGLEGSTDAELTDALIERINKFNNDLNIPHSMKEYGVAEDDFKANLDFISKNAVADACTGSNPREIDANTMAKLFECTYYGNKVEF